MGQIACCKGHSSKRLPCVRKADLVRSIAQASRWADRQVDGWVDKLGECFTHVQERGFQARSREEQDRLGTLENAAGKLNVGQRLFAL